MKGNYHARIMELGWIKLHRKILDNGIMKDDPTAFIVFMALLLLANRETGEVEIGRFMLESVTGIKGITAYKALSRIEKKWEMVTQSSNNKFTTILIKNWHKYQDNEKDSNNAGNNKVTTKEQQSNNKVTTAVTPLNKEDKKNTQELRIKNEELRNNAKALQPVGWGNPEINQVYEFLKSQLAGTPDGTIAINRRYAKLLLDRMRKDYPEKTPVEQVSALIKYGLQDKFHGKNITNFEYLYRHAQQIIQSLKSQSMKQETKGIKL